MVKKKQKQSLNVRSYVRRDKSKKKGRQLHIYSSVLFTAHIGTWFCALSLQGITTPDTALHPTEAVSLDCQVGGDEHKQRPVPPRRPPTTLTHDALVN
jgi:hypothetical protein